MKQPNNIIHKYVCVCMCVDEGVSVSMQSVKNKCHKQINKQTQLINK